MKSARPSILPRIDLTCLRAGDRARFVASSLPRPDLDLLAALGLTESCLLRVCQTRDPWIVEVRATRIGLAESVAKAIFVSPEARP
jgi:Fe2+ transport system protein FeoA